MVEFVRHSSVNGRIDFDVDIVAELVVTELGFEGDLPVLPELPLEQSFCARTITKGVWHVKKIYSPDQHRARGGISIRNMLQ
jgi:hypothetical protein